MLYLASASPRRKQLLELLSVPFDVHPVDADERPPRGLPPEHVPVVLSQKKASLAADELEKGVLLAADTVVIHQGQLLGKPESKEEARNVLRTLSDRTHSVVTGVTVQYAGGSHRESISCETRVALRSFDDEELEAYIASGTPLDRAGGYGIQDRSLDPVQSLNGCPANVRGLPICVVPELLRSFDVDVPNSNADQCSPEKKEKCHLQEQLHQL